MKEAKRGAYFYSILQIGSDSDCTDWCIVYKSNLLTIMHDYEKKFEPSPFLSTCFIHQSAQSLSLSIYKME